MDFANFLREKHETTAALHQAHHASVLELQEALYRDTLPGIAKQLVYNENCLHREKDWIDDEGSMFRMLKKHQFRVDDACAALNDTLAWRVSVLGPLLESTATADRESFIQCLPGDARDTAGRPILLIKLAGLPGAPEDSKQDILCAYDAMRLRLRRAPVFQCLLMIDFKGANVRSLAAESELVPWFMREIAPRFPGMCAGVLMVNYSWMYSGMYNFVKRLLPSAVLERISFPTLPELLTHFERGCLPREYGGELDLSPPPAVDVLAAAPAANPHPADRRHVTPAPKNIILAAYLPSMSLLNPFYGYPTISNPGSSIPKLKNGRRRKRDLARTLTLLWLAKLKRTAEKTWLWIVMTLILWVAEGLRR